MNRSRFRSHLTFLAVIVTLLLPTHIPSPKTLRAPYLVVLLTLMATRLPDYQ
ncbi:hypothetical protein J4G02_16175 [Candidatus Poribacteria bacterium]|nr:hypothetical protein [Candidatus Poribacteria bacterium]